MKKILKKIILMLGKYLGYDISVHKRSSNISYIFIDKNSWDPFLNTDKNYIRKLYKESLDKSDSTYSDSFEKQLRFYSLFNIVENILKNHKYQNFVECGCWKGHSTLGITKLMEKYSFNKNFYVFDSFEDGLSEKNTKDKNSNRYIQTKKDIVHQKQYFESDYDKVLDLFHNYNFVKIYKGWIPKVFDNLEKDFKISFLHLDVDLYQPTYDSLIFFYDMIEVGGIIICDDYNSSDFPGAKIAIDEFMKEKSINLFYEVPLGGCIIIK